MKTFTHFFLATILLATLSFAGSCSKDKDTPPPPEPVPVIGIWKGSVVGNGNPTPVKFDIKENGQVTVFSQNTQFSGSWKFAAGNFEATFDVQGVQATAAGLLSAGKNKIDGTWKENNNGKITEQKLALAKD
ncbi:hypothetical protein [Niabella beijingensis]|uniref:hypothetical protein n=1 Tax=Niabella beijingensis TaxID=2872700 RepID=UPI001CBF7ACB|nr:hypothetical protein [Niabella beijingensis]MBZ4187493.1 hypothetical protein [Niabella beijingensis]